MHESIKTIDKAISENEQVVKEYDKEPVVEKDNDIDDEKVHK